MFFIFFIYLASVYLLMSCEDAESDNIIDSAVQLKLITSGELVVSTDSLFTVETASNFFISGSEELPVLTVRLSDLIYDFDLVSGTQVSRKEVPLEGPSSIGDFNQLDGIAKLEDSTYLYFSHFLKEVYKISKDTVFSTMNREEAQPHEINFMSASYAPIESVNEYLLISTIPSTVSNLSKLPAITLYNTETNQISHPLHYSEKYGQHFWGYHPYQYLTSVRYIESLNKFYVSYPIEDFVYVYDKDFNFEQKKSVSSKYIRKIDYLHDEPIQEGQVYDYNKDRDYFTNLSYYPLAFYDSNSSRYYRIARKVLIEESGERLLNYTVIVCDSNLNVLDEVELDEQYSIVYSFMSPKGLMLYNTSKNVKDSELHYDLVNFVEVD
ncbi:MAG: hypothetical protein AAGI49_07940 [Bacteroidota bacterium]